MENKVESSSYSLVGGTQSQVRPSPERRKQLTDELRDLRNYLDVIATTRAALPALLVTTQPSVPNAIRHKT